jgi:hypothetical protein
MGRKFFTGDKLVNESIRMTNTFMPSATSGLISKLEMHFKGSKYSIAAQIVILYAKPLPIEW